MDRRSVMVDLQEEKDWLARQSTNNVVDQASHGSVAAIIHLLNEKLATCEIRTRAVLTRGVLELLCEAPNPECLDRDSTVMRVSHLLEYLAPKGIRRARLYARVVQEQQVLWLEAIQREPEHLLWSEELPIKRSHWFRWMWRDLQRRQSSGQASEAWMTSQKSKRPRQGSFWGGVIGGAAIATVLLLGAAWQLDWFSSSARDDKPTATSDRSGDDAFVRAVRLAESASIAGQTASSPQQWEALATRWQEAADLMRSVPSEDRRYKTASDRGKVYANNAEQAKRQAENLREQN